MRVAVHGVPVRTGVIRGFDCRAPSEEVQCDEYAFRWPESGDDVAGQPVVDDVGL